MFEYLFLITLVFLIAVLLLYQRLAAEIKILRFDRQSLLTRFGKTTEQFIPFLKKYKYNPENFRFLGTPIDGVQFEGDRIVFVEFKTGDSKLTARQENIRQLVRKGRVEFEEIRI